MELWKFGGNELKMHLLELFNKIIDKNQMPQEWETGMVINIHKKGTKKTRKLQMNYFIAYSLQIIYKHNKKQNNTHLEDEIVEEQCGFSNGAQFYRCYIHGATDN